MSDEPVFLIIPRRDMIAGLDRKVEGTPGPAAGDEYTPVAGTRPPHDPRDKPHDHCRMMHCPEPRRCIRDGCQSPI